MQGIQSVSYTHLDVYKRQELRVNEPAKQDAWEWFPIDQLPKHIYSPSKKFIDAYCMAENRCVRTMNAEGEGYEAV